MLSYEVRRATADDLPDVVELASAMVVHSVSPFRAINPEEVKEFRRRDLQALEDAVTQPNVAVFVAVERESGRFLGHVVVVSGHTESSTGESQSWIFDISVIHECWSAGVGKALVERAEDFSRARGMRYIGLGVTSANERAVRFYERLGYAEERKRMIKVLDPENPD